MKRFFGKSKSEQSARASEDVPEEAAEEETNKEAEQGHSKKTPPRKSRNVRESEEDVGQGDAGKRVRRKGIRESQPIESEEPEQSKPTRKLRSQRERVSESEPDIVEQLDSNEDQTAGELEFLKKPKPLPRRKTGSTGNLFSQSDSESGENDQYEDVEERPQEVPSSSKSKSTSAKEIKTKKRRDRSKTLQNDSGSDTGVTQYVSIRDSKRLPKVETVKGGHYFSTVLNYRQPISNFRIRAQLLKYPSFTDQQLLKGELAVVDERTFEWQEKVFSKAEAKKYQSLENCVTEQEKKYHDELSQDTKSVGKYLHTYVNDDLYVTKKKMKLLTRRCPVPHTLKEKHYARLGLDTSTRSFDSEELTEAGGGGALPNINSDDSIDFDEPISSSTPMQQRKAKEKGTTEIAKQEKRVRERREKELKVMEKQNIKVKELQVKKEKEEEKKKQQEQAKFQDKMRKLEEIETKEKEFRQEYMKKYKYSKRPSMPLGARMRSVRLTPSPGKLDRKKKSYTISRSSEISDFQDDESGPSLGSKEDGGRDIDEHGRSGVKTASKVGTEYGEYGRGSKFSSTVVDSKNYRKFSERLAYHNTQTMYIMASIPYLPGKQREMVVCKIQSIPDQQVVVFKPSLGYRTIEAKRNNMFRISCELCPTDAQDAPATRQVTGRKLEEQGLGDIHGDAGFFENVPKNELRLCVMGEITSAQGFEMSPLCIYYAIDIPKGWRNDSLQSNTEGMTHTCFTDHEGYAHFSHEFSFQLVFSMDFIDEPNHLFPTPVIALMAVSMNHPSPRIVYEGYGYVTIPMTPGCHFIKIRMWKPRPRTVVEKMRAAFLDISPSLQDMKLVHINCADGDENGKANLIGLHTEPSGSVKLRLHVIHQTPSVNKEYESNLDLLEKMSSATILRSVQAVIQAFQRARQKAENIKSQYD